MQWETKSCPALPAGYTPAVSDDQPSSPSPRAVAYLCPLYGLFCLGNSVGRKIILIILTVLQLGVGLLTMVFMGWVRVDWDGRGLPGSLRWNLTARSKDSFATSQYVANENNPASWPGYRGAKRDGVYTGPALRFDWKANPPKQLWKTAIGGGHSGTTIAHGRLYTMEQWDEGEAVTAYNLIDGRGLWHHVYEGSFNDSGRMGGVGPRSTPTWDDGRLYTLGAEGQLYCFDAATGKVIWQKDLFAVFESRNIMFGMCGSPWVQGDRLFLTMGAGKFTVAALNKKSGEIIWKTEDAEKQAYVSPFTTTLAGREQLILGAGREVQGLSLEDGTVLWRDDWRVSYDNHIAQPIVLDEQHLFVSAGYGTGCALYKITDNNDTFKSEQIWFNKELKNKFTSSVLHKGYIYGLDDAGGENAAYLTCLEAKTGKLIWRGKENYGHGQLLLADGHLIIQCEDGSLALAKASPDSHQMISRQSALNGKTWNNPTLAGGRLYLRNDRELICYDVSQGSEAGSAATFAVSSESLPILLAAFLVMNGLGLLILGALSRNSTTELTAEEDAA